MGGDQDATRVVCNDSRGGVEVQRQRWGRIVICAVVPALVRTLICVVGRALVPAPVCVVVPSLVRIVLRHSLLSPSSPLFLPSPPEPSLVPRDGHSAIVRGHKWWWWWWLNETIR